MRLAVCGVTLSLVAVIGFSVFFVPASYGQEKYIPVTKYDPQRNADQDIRDAIAEAKLTNRRILLEVGGEWCSWCHILDNYFAAHSDLVALRDKNFVTLKINFSEENPFFIFNLATIRRARKQLSLEGCQLLGRNASPRNLMINAVANIDVQISALLHNSTNRRPLGHRFIKLRIFNQPSLSYSEGVSTNHATLPGEKRHREAKD